MCTCTCMYKYTCTVHVQGHHNTRDYVKRATVKTKRLYTALTSTHVHCTCLHKFAYIMLSKLIGSAYKYEHATQVHWYFIFYSHGHRGYVIIMCGPRPRVMEFMALANSLHFLYIHTSGPNAVFENIDHLYSRIQTQTASNCRSGFVMEDSVSNYENEHWRGLYYRCAVQAPQLTSFTGSRA